MKSKVSRRRLIQSSVALTAAGGGAAAPAQESGGGLESLRHLAFAHGLGLSDERLRMLKPVLDQRQAQIETVRRFEIDSRVEPTQGIGRVK